MEKIIIFTHESDIDGIGCLVLAKLAFKDVDYVLSPNVEDLELVFRKYIQNGLLDTYEKIFITDLSLYDPSLTMVADSELKNKVLVFDHHQRAIDMGMNRYSFTTIIEEDDTGKKCGTLLFYEYLVGEGLLNKNKKLDDFVEMTRLEDMWEWKKDKVYGKNAHDLAILFNIIGREKYVESMFLKLKNEKDFSLNVEESELVKNCILEYKNVLSTLVDEIEYFIDENGNKYGIVLCNYEYRNDFAEYIVEIGNPENIKYLIIVAMDKGENGQKSYRSISEEFDVNEIAIKHGGGGHPRAAAVNISKDQKEKILYLEKREGLKFLADSSYN